MWGISTGTVVSCIVNNLASLKRMKTKLNITYNFYKIVQNLGEFQNKLCISKIVSFSLLP